MNAVAVAVPEAVKVLAERAARNDKFQDFEVNAELASLAKAYLTTYTGDFEFLVSVRGAMQRNDGRLNAGQVRGVLNCMLADLRRNPPETSEPEVDPESVGFFRRPLNVKPGYFTIVLADGSHRTLRIQRGKIGANAKEKFFIGFLNGPVNTMDYTRCAVVFRNKLTWIPPYGNDGALRLAVEYLVTMTDAQKREAGVAYATESNNCFNCGATLTEPESIAAKLGPICRARW